MVVPAEAIERYLAQAPRAIPRFKGVNPRVLTAAIQNQYNMPFRPAKTPARGVHQLEGVAFALYLQRALLFYDMRLGKTWMALNWAAFLKQSGCWPEGRKGLVIVHAPIALDVWEAEAPKHSNLKVYIVHTKLHEFIAALESDCDLVIVPWSGLQRIFAEKRSVKVRKVVNGRTKYVAENKLRSNFDMANTAAEAFCLVVIDEIHRAKNKGTLRFKIALALTRQCLFRLGLTGTPFGRDPFDLWAQSFLIDNGKTLGASYNFFREAFSKKKKNRAGITELVFDNTKEPLLRARMSTLALSYERAEVHDVNILKGQIDLHMEGEQRAAYERAVDRLIKINENETAELNATFVRLRQISSGYLPFIDAEGAAREIIFPYNPKTTWLADFLEQDFAVQLVIFHEFIRSGEIICDVLKEAKVPHGWLYGGTRNPSEVITQFTSGQTKVLVSNVVKGGMAIDLPSADYVLFWESPTSPVIRQQAEARPMSRGSKLLMIDDMICSGVERKILSFLREGHDLLQSIVRDRHGLR